MSRTANGSHSAAASVEEYIEILSAEQHVDLDKLRDYARHGCQPQVRGEVWLYLLGVLSDDKSQEMTSVRSKYLEYEQLDKHHPALEKRIRGECARYYQRRLATSAIYSMPWQENHHPYHASQFASSSNEPSASRDSALSSATGTRERGPNRIDGALANARVGIMGGIGSSGMLGSHEDEDPVAAAAEELKRFSAAVGSVVCAHLNRWDHNSGRHTERKDSVILAPFKTVDSDSGSDHSSFGSKGDGPHELRQASTSRLSSWPSFQASSSQQESAERTASNSQSSSSTNFAMHEHETAPLSASPSQESQGASSAHLEARNDHSGTASDVTSTMRPGASLPREYEWAHSGPAIAVNSTTAFDGVSSGQSVSSVVAADHFRHRSSLSDGAPEAAIEGAASVSPQAREGTTTAPRATFEGFSPDLVFLCAPFVKCVRVEAGMFFAFDKLMSMIDKYNARNPLPAQVSGFLTLFRTTLPDLYAYFEEEEVDVVAFATSWLRHLLAGEMQMDDLLRLWDTYFAIPDPLDLHLFVCIAILTNCKDALEELDQSEAKSMLYSLPQLDVDRILQEARNIQVSVRQSQAESL
ncbi:ypt rab-specific gtpase-activating protein gyp1 [Ceraceosorus bombacis]|uniref:Ypt rab-specific gtpase-activating protein gyp1 n=1 Tax=Ceraceosorus bombacis TaxID=401625 RepID=A0A0P1BQK9_9BASI|nr:ypt rab-specific gtpase-activating protein gyp1 [Ceraceosorus bombacis]